MNKSILFICRKASNISIRRYLYLSNLFGKYGYKSIFLGIDNADESYIEECLNDLLKYYNIKLKYLNYNYIKFNNLEEIMQNDEYTQIFKDSDISNPLEKLFCKNHLNAGIKKISNLFYIFDKFIRSINCSLVFFDIPISWTINVFIDVAKYNNINTISLEHAEGMTKIYSNFEPFADYYVSYGDYSYTNLLSMNIPKEKIWKIGNIDNDLIKNINHYSKKEGILLIFKPFKLIGSKQLNFKLLKKTIELFPNEKIYIKLHPSVYDLDETKKIVTKWISNNEKIKIVNLSEPIAVSLSKTTKCITFNSFAIIEAIQMKNSILCLEDIQNFAYPNWKELSSNIDVFITTEFLNLKNYEWKIQKNNTDNIENHFRYKQNNVGLNIVLKSIQLIEENK